MFYYYYNKLNNQEKKIYWQLESAIRELRNEILLNSFDVSLKRVCDISRMVTIDSPEFYWTKGSFNVINEGPSSAQLRLSFFFNKAKRLEADSIISQKIKLMGIETTDTTEEKVEKVYDWMLNNVQYDAEAGSVKNPLNQTIYSVFVDGKSLCMGIAKAFDLVMRLLGIDSFVVLGNVFGDKEYGHSWNTVKVGNEYRHVDVTMGYDLFKPLWKKYYGDKSNRCVLVPYEYISKSHLMDDAYKYWELDDVWS